MKKVKTIIKLQVPGGKANPAPPVGPALGQHGLNIMDFCNKFNNNTKDRIGQIIPVEINVYEDRTFDVTYKQSPVADMIKKELNLEKGSGEPNKNKVGKISKEQIKKIAQAKMSDLNVNSIESAMNIVAGTAKSMGVEVK